MASSNWGLTLKDAPLISERFQEHKKPSEDITWVLADLQYKT